MMTGQSRRKRKRDRRRAEATARVPFWQGVSGGDAPELSLADLALIRQAAAQGWDVPAHQHQPIVEAVFAGLTPEAAPRRSVAIVRTALAMSDPGRSRVRVRPARPTKGGA